MQIPYARPEHLRAGMLDALPRRPFFVRASDYQIVDGDTLRVLSGERDENNRRKEAFRIRFASVNAPELSKGAPADAALRAVGLSFFPNNPGEVARREMVDLLKDKAILVEPVGADRYQRCLAHVTASGSPGRLFDLTGAFSIERILFQKNLVTLQPGSFDVPAETPAILAAIGKDDREDLVPGF